MNQINILDLKGFASNAVVEVYDMMLSMTLEPIEEDPLPVIEGQRIVGSVGLAGDVMGNVCIHVSDAFARQMTAAMLGMEIDEIEGEEEVHDVIGELSNMIGGDLKSRLCDAGMPCELSIPSITSGSDFTIESMDWMRHEKFGFRHEGELTLVEIFIKSGS